MDYEKKIEKLRNPYVRGNEGCSVSMIDLLEKINEIIDVLNKEHTPELRESEDEEIRKWIIEELEITRDAMSGKNDYSDDPDIVARLKRLDEAIYWLEEQKESLHVPESCKENSDSFTDDHPNIIYTEMGEEFAKQKEQKPVQSEEEKEYIRTIKSLISDFIRGKEDYIERGYYQQIYDWLDGRHVEQKPNIEICHHSIKSKSYSENPITPEMMDKAADECIWNQCDDNRFWIIDRAKKDILAKTNIESSSEEMKVLDCFLFRCWQMGWLSKYDVIVPEQKPYEPHNWPADKDNLTQEQKPVQTSDFKTKLAEYLQNNTPKDGQYVISSESILEMAKEELIKRGELKEQDSVKFEEGFKVGRESGLRDGQKYVLNNLDSYGLCKPAWNEEDEKMRDRIIDILNRTFSVYSALGTSSTRPSCPTYKDEVNWLKSIRPGWKPTEEQMNAFKNSVEHIPNAYYDGMWELYEQLKKLM